MNDMQFTTRERGDWPKLFTGEETCADVMATARSPLEGKMAIVAYALQAWGMCASGMYYIPDTFGDSMAAVDMFLDRCSLPKDLAIYADELLAQHKLENGE